MNQVTNKWEVHITMNIKGLNQYGDDAGGGTITYCINLKNTSLAEIISKLEALKNG